MKTQLQILVEDMFQLQGISPVINWGDRFELEQKFSEYFESLPYSQAANESISELESDIDTQQEYIAQLEAQIEGDDE